MLKRTFAGALAALTLGVTVAATPASAGWYGPRWGYGWHRGGWGGGPVAAGVLGGLAVGAIAAGAAGAYYPPYGYPAYGAGYPGAGYGYPGAGYGYPGCYLQRQPMFDPYGNFMGYRRFRVCN